MTGQVQVVALTGTIGAGKTTLAESVSDRFTNVTSPRTDRPRLLVRSTRPRRPRPVRYELAIPQSRRRLAKFAGSASRMRS